MAAASKTYHQLTSRLTDKRTSSRASASGATRSSRRSTVQPHRKKDSGPAVVLASLSARQAKAKGLLTSGTCGLAGSGLSTRAALSFSLASRLHTVAQRLGSILYKMTWKEWATPQGRSVWALVGSADRTSVSALIGWPTPGASDGSGGRKPKDPLLKLRANGTKVMQTLNAAAYLAGWPTPTTPSGGRSSKGMSITGMKNGKKHTVSLEHAAKFTGPLRLQTSGGLVTGYTVPTESSGQLNPELSRWLMGLPKEWDDCAAMVTQSSRRLR